MYYTRNEATNTVGNCTATLLGSNFRGCQTFELVYPRIIHAEFMTHRLMCRNAASSRATPVSTMIREVLEHPYIPKVWPKNCKGMSAKENETDPEMINHFVQEWLNARDYAVVKAKFLSRSGLHKEIVNRLLEPFQYIRVIATSTDWDYFIKLRKDPKAQPDIQDLAKAIEGCNFHSPAVPAVTHIGRGDVYFPYLDEDYVLSSPYDFDTLALISAAKCARVSYLKHDGTDSSPEEDIELGKRLIKDKHLTPFEHIVYTPDIRDEFYGPLCGAMNYRYLLENGVTFKDILQKPDIIKDIS